MCLNLDENCEEALFNPLTQELIYISHDICVWVDVRRGGYPLPNLFL